MSLETDMLQLSGLHAYYGKSHILHGVDMRIGEGEIVSLLGRNGSGRSTTVKTIMGLVHGEGSVKFRDAEILGHHAFDIAHRGIGYVPEAVRANARVQEAYLGSVLADAQVAEAGH